MALSPTIVWLLVKFGFNVGQQENSVLADPMWIDCLEDYIKLAIVVMINAVLTYMGDPATILIQFIKIMLWKARKQSW